MNNLYIEENSQNVKKGNVNLLWNDFNSDEINKIYSINKILEKNKIFYRKKLIFVGNLYLNKVWRKSKLNYVIDDNFDYFFLSSIFHQSAFRENSFHLLLAKFFVTREFIKKNNPSKVYISIHDKNYSDLIYKYCVYKNIKVEVNNLGKFKINSFFLRFGKTKNFIREFLFLISKISLKEKKFKILDNDILLFDTFTHFDLEELKKGNYKSYYWNSLVDLIKKNNLKVKWIHFFYRTKQIRYLNDANKIIKKLNVKEKNNNHLLLDSLFSLRSAFTALFIYFKFLLSYFSNAKSLRIRNSFFYGAFNEILTPYLRDTFIGQRAIRNIYFFECFKNLVKRVDKPKFGLYLMENLDFEIILNYLWKKKTNYELIGFPHSSVRFWDLRYFFLNPKKFLNIFPNKVLIHSKDSLNWSENIKLNYKSTIAVESLRFEKLILKKRIHKKTNFKNFLVFGDLDERITLSMLELFDYQKNKKFFVKNHPGSSIIKKNYKNITFIENHEHVLDNYDCVIVSNASATIFKPYYENFPFLVFLDSKFFNLNPISNLNENLFFYDTLSFEKSLLNILQNYSNNKKLHIIDNTNSQWLKILSNKDSNENFNKLECLKLIEN